MKIPVVLSSTRFASELAKTSFGVEEEGQSELFGVSLRENERREIGDINCRQVFQGAFL